MDASIVLITRTGGEINSCVAEGVLNLTDSGFSLTYNLDGDGCLLEYDGRSVSQSRKGKINYFVKFTGGKKCSFEFTEGAYSFSRDINVFKAQADIKDLGCEISVTYADCGADGKEVTEILVTAHYKK